MLFNGTTTSASFMTESHSNPHHLSDRSSSDTGAPPDLSWLIIFCYLMTPVDSQIQSSAQLATWPHFVQNTGMWVPPDDPSEPSVSAQHATTHPSVQSTLVNIPHPSDPPTACTSQLSSQWSFCEHSMPMKQVHLMSVRVQAHLFHIGPI